MTQLYWPFEHPNQFSPTRDSTGGALDQNATFQPENGPSITRRRTTARVEAWQIGIQLETRAQLAEFEAWFDGPLKAGSLPFLWRHPTRGDVRKFRFMPASYDTSAQSVNWVRLSFGVMILPGAVPMAPYIPSDSARPPDWVADYSLGLFWIDGLPVSSGAMASISGDYLVLEQRGTSTQRFLTATYSGDVPTTAPSGVAWLAGFAQ